MKVQIAQLQDQISQLEEGVRQAEEAEAQIPALTQALERSSAYCGRKKTAALMRLSQQSVKRRPVLLQPGGSGGCPRIEAGDHRRRLLPIRQQWGTARGNLGSSSGNLGETARGELNAANGAVSGHGQRWIPGHGSNKEARSWKPDLRLPGTDASRQRKKDRIGSRRLDFKREGQKAIDAGRETLKQEEAKLGLQKNRLPQTKKLTEMKRSFRKVWQFKQRSGGNRRKQTKAELCSGRNRSKRAEAEFREQEIGDQPAENNRWRG